MSYAVYLIRDKTFTNSLSDSKATWLKHILFQQFMVLQYNIYTIQSDRNDSEILVIWFFS